MVEISKFAKFKVGQVIKNYIEFCKLLEEEVKTYTRSRNAQKKEWKRYLSWDEKGHKYIITEVRDIPIDKVDGRCNGNNSKYVKYTRRLFLDYIFSCSKLITDNEYAYIEIRTYQLYKILGFHNNRYRNTKNIHNNTYLNSLSQKDINQFYFRSNKKFYEISKSTLSSLISTRKALSVNTVYKIQDDVERNATESEINAMKNIEGEILVEYGLDNKDVFFRRGEQKSYYEILNKRLIERFGWILLHPTKEIRLDINELKKKELYTIDECSKKQMLLTINGLIHAFLDRNAEENYRKNQEKVKLAQDDDDFFSDEPYELPEDYIEKQKFLSELLIKIDE